MPLFALPEELLLEVAGQLEERDINAFSRANRRLHRVLDVYLYRHNVRHSQGSALLWAAQRGNEKLARRLLEHGASVDVQNDNWETPLLLAARAGHAAVARLLLAVDGVDADIKHDTGTPLRLAAQNGHAETVSALLESGSVKANGDDGDGGDDDDGERPLWWAAKGGHEAVVKLLLSDSAVRPDARGVDLASLVEDELSSTPLCRAAMEGHAPVVRLLLGTGKVDPNSYDSYDRTPLVLAACEGYKEIVELLLAADSVDVNAADDHGDTPLYLAANAGRDDIVKLLLEKGADIEAKNRTTSTALHAASCSGYPDTVQLLLQNGSNIAAETNNAHTALHLASGEGHLEVAKVLLGHDAPLETQDENLHTPLHRAVCQDQPGMVQLLLEQGALVHAPMEGTKWPVLSHAAEHGLVDVMRRLLDNAAARDEIDTKGPDGWTALYNAFEQAHIGAMHLLLERGAQMRSVREYHDIFQAAVWNGSLSTIRLLEGKRDSVSGAQDPRELPESLHLACIRGHSDIVEHLASNGADPGEEDEHGWNAFYCNAHAEPQQQARISEVLAKFDRGHLKCSPLEPTALSDTDMSSCLSLSENNTTVTYTGFRGTGQLRFASILADHPVPLDAKEFYFEITILDAGETGEIALGLCHKYAPLDTSPGWYSGSWAYHADDGKVYLQSGIPGQSNDPLSEPGTVLGCRYFPERGEIEFSNGGGCFGIASSDVCGKLYPVVGLGGPGASVKVNFKQGDFIRKGS